MKRWSIQANISSEVIHNQSRRSDVCRENKITKYEPDLCLFNKHSFNTTKSTTTMVSTKTQAQEKGGPSL